MTDLEDFTAFFKSKGVRCAQYPAPGVEAVDCLDRDLAGLSVCDAIFKFNDDGEFIGVLNFENGGFDKRIPAPEH